MNKKTLAFTVALVLPAGLIFAQRPGGPPPPPGGLPPGPPPDQQQGGDPRHPHGNRPPKEPKDNGDKDRPDKPPVPPLINALDSDHDGIISAAELKAAPDALATLDKNKDGKLTPDEFGMMRPDGPPPGGPKDGDKKPVERPFPGSNPPREGDPKPAGPKDGDGKPQRPPPPIIGALDADRDGVISADEIADAANALLTLDKNGDGQLGPVEYMGRPPGDRPPGDRPDGNDPKPPRPPKEGR